VQCVYSAVQTWIVSKRVIFHAVNKLQCNDLLISQDLNRPRSAHIRVPIKNHTIVSHRCDALEAVVKTITSARSHTPPTPSPRIGYSHERRFCSQPPSPPVPSGTALIQYSLLSTDYRVPTANL